jgi:glycosyltransferase involved in cell wall biosynthesis
VLQLHNLAIERGGVENVIAADTGVLEAAGVEVELMTIRTGDVYASSRLKAGAKAVWNVETAREVRDRIKAFAPDIAHVYTPFPVMSPAVFRTTTQLQIPTVTTLQSYRYSCIKALFYRDGHVCEDCLGKTFKLPGIRHRCYHDSLLGSSTMTLSLVVHRTIGTFRNNVDVWLPTSGFMRDKLIAEGMPAHKIIVKPNTTPDLGHQPLPAGDNALFAGRLVPEKGVQAMLDAWASSPSLPALTVLGDGPLRGLVELAAAADPRITFKGWVDQDTVISELGAARYLILPSEWYEGQPVIALQSFAAGTPIVASDVGNFSEMIDPGANGFLFRSGDSESLASAVATAWGPASADERARFRSEARRTYVEHHSEDANREILMAAYEQAVRTRRSRSNGSATHGT